MQKFLSSSVRGYLVVAAGLAIAVAPAAYAQDNTPIETPPSDATMPMQIGEQAFLWRVHLQPGTRYQTRIFTRSVTTSKVPAFQGSPASNVESTQWQTMKLDNEVVSVDRFGAATVRVTYRDIDTTSKVSVNGREQGTSEEAKQGMDAFKKAFIGQSLDIKMAPDGVVWSIVGTKELTNRIKQSLSDMPFVGRTQVGSLVSQLLDENQLKRTFGQFKGALPAQPVRVSESWNYNLPTVKYGPYSLQVDGRRTLNKIENGVAFVQENLELQMDSEAISIGGGTFKVSELRGTTTGSSKVNVQNGLINEGYYNQRLNMKMAATLNGQSMNYPVTADVTARVVNAPN